MPRHLYVAQERPRCCIRMPPDLHQDARGGRPGTTIMAAAIPDSPAPCPRPVPSPQTSINVNHNHIAQQPSFSSSHSPPTFTTSPSTLTPSNNHVEPSHVKLALSLENSQTHRNVLGEAVFPDWRDDATSADLIHPDEMQKKDPLGTQIWKLYSRTKTQLPNQERMENLTWRMMAMNLKRKEQERLRFVCAQLCIRLLPTVQASPTDILSHARKLQQPTIAPSGIAQLRQSHHLTDPDPDPDPMNLDDFIVPNSIASPDRNPSPSPPREPLPAPSNTVASAIPIKIRKESEQAAHPNFAPSAPSHDRSRTREFDYVQRRLRKTSIDGTRVRTRICRWQYCRKVDVGLCTVS